MPEGGQAYTQAKHTHKNNLIKKKKTVLFLIVSHGILESKRSLNVTTGPLSP